ncbi:MAG: hypothetical protein A2Y17_02640 [Clostridiales bacterium GWF2_38_85]|nr:MAG: hypothetical protein A2Y17_02640 [Clostridiales bacterium GWF2_38_85]
MERYNGLGTGLSNLFLLSDAKSRSICAENYTGEKSKAGMATEGMGKNCARDLGEGWKVSPYFMLEAGQTVTIADIDGSGAIKHIWTTVNSRYVILRIYWDDSKLPSVEVPMGDFFCNPFSTHYQVSSLTVCVNPNKGLNCYWEMPFNKKCRITVENLDINPYYFFYQVDYVLTEVPEDIGYFHAQFRRTNPLPYKSVYTILDNIKGKGQYVGTYMTWGVNNNGWWGEGEIKFYLDGDDMYPTICGTGTEDYFGGAYNFDVNGKYTEFTNPYSGMPTVIRPDGLYSANQRFGLYRWHITDPIRFEEDIKITIQALGWRSGGRYLPLQDDISSVAYWYQTLPISPFPKMLTKDELEII